jgi:hypothetical protein
MRKVYLDVTQASMCVSVYVKDAEVVLAGTTINPMSVREKKKNSEYQRFADEYDINFIFDDNVPKVDFYTIPMVDIFATDSEGGYIGSLGRVTDLQENIPICYIDKDKKCYLIADNGNDFIANASNWKSNMTEYTDIEFFNSLSVAQEKYEFLDRASISKMDANDTIAASIDIAKYQREFQRKKILWGLILSILGIGVIVFCVYVHLNGLRIVMGGVDGPTSVFLVGKIGISRPVIGVLIGCLLLIIGIITIIRTKNNDK